MTIATKARAEPMANGIARHEFVRSVFTAHHPTAPVRTRRGEAGILDGLFGCLLVERRALFHGDDDRAVLDVRLHAFDPVERVQLLLDSVGAKGAGEAGHLETVARAGGKDRRGGPACEKKDEYCAYDMPHARFPFLLTALALVEPYGLDADARFPGGAADGCVLHLTYLMREVAIRTVVRSQGRKTSSVEPAQGTGRSRSAG
jgi:hypothetical protein